jgi:hypothetical protein
MRASAACFARSDFSHASCDEVHAPVIEAVVAGAEKLLPRLPVVERGVVLSRHEAHVLVPEAFDDVVELGQAPPSLFRIVGGVREVAGEDDEVRLKREAVHRCDRFLQRAARVRIHGRAVEAPVRVRQLDEVEVAVRRVGELGPPGETRGEYHAAQARQLQKFPAINRLRHLVLLYGWEVRGRPRPAIPCKTGAAAVLFPNLRA